MPWSSQGQSLTTPGPRGWCHSKPQTGVSFKCRRLLVHLRGRGCPVSAGPPQHLPHSPLPLHPPTSSSSMASHLHHPPQTHTAPHNPHPLYTTTPSPPTPSPTLHHPHTPAPTPSTPPPSPPSKDPVQCHHWDIISLPGFLWIPYSLQKPVCPIEYPGVAGRREDREPQTGFVQVSGAEEALCPASAHWPSWRAAHPAQDTSP